MLFTYIDLGSQFTTSTLNLAGTLISDLAPYITLVIGVLIVGTIVATLIMALKR